MTTHLMKTRRAQATGALAAGAALTLTLGACAGSAGGGGGGEGGGDGFEYGADQSEVDELIKDLDPVTIKYQPSSASAQSVMAPTGTVFKEIVEERSGGKITVEIVWGQAIASYAEVHDALADGRVDVAYTLPGYFPDEFPVIDAIGTAMADQPASPFAGELVTNAVGSDIAWQIPEAIEEYESKGLVPLTPFAASGGYYNVCAEPTSSADDWKGRQIRIASQAQAAQVTKLGGSPVSLPYPETYEALQRGTVDCTLGQLVPSAESGIFDVAPNLGYTTDHSFSRTAGAYLAGQTFTELPLAYQQIIFDSNALAASGGMKAVIDGNADAISQAKAAGGEVTPFDDDVQDNVGEYSQELIKQAVTDGKLSQENVDAIAEATKRQQRAVEDLGYVDDGETGDFDEWYDKDTDYTEFAKHTYENGKAMEHRPS
ncbi:TRAP transporter substrate-binding protein DctP [Brevibacterium luteolum]|uniref:TRAP transporter substrate-binding protein DctP n=1 Tax=Brevibacterium luteolum TaxID=199591 RepID=UPI0021AF5413|nr:TRAP transporter substrate-binding protein DctP [Brevibacterium luteolum]